MLIIDEAQLVPHKETFDEIRLLTNFQLDDRNLISVVLMGQPELRKRLAHRAYEPLRQRIGMQYDLHPFPWKKLPNTSIIDWRRRREPGLFLPAPWSASSCIPAVFPRKINHAASLALLEGFGREAERIGPEVLDAIMPEVELTRLISAEGNNDGSC